MKIIAKKKHLDYQNAVPREKPHKVRDGDGLFLLVRPSGGKVWQMLYTHGGKNKTYTFGPFPEIIQANLEQRPMLNMGWQNNAHIDILD